MAQGIARPLLSGLASLLALACLAAAPAQAAPPQQVPAPGKVTLVDLGATTCIPCRMMAPVLSELEQEYRGRAAVVFIDVRQTPEAGKRFGIRVIPTQIFFDRKGREVSRHEGYLDKKTLSETLNSLLAK